MESSHYVDKERLLEELKIFYELAKKAKENGEKRPKISDYIGQCILLTSQKMSNRREFIKYPFKEEMIGDGIENCLMYIHNFDPAISSNPFGYISRIIYWAFVRRIEKEKKKLYTKYKMIRNYVIHDENYEQNEWDEIKQNTYVENHNMDEFIKNFEESMVRKKKQKSKVGLEKFIEDDVLEIEPDTFLKEDV